MGSKLEYTVYRDDVKEWRYSSRFTANGEGGPVSEEGFKRKDHALDRATAAAHDGDIIIVKNADGTEDYKFIKGAAGL